MSKHGRAFMALQKNLELHAKYEKRIVQSRLDNCAAGGCTIGDRKCVQVVQPEAGQLPEPLPFDADVHFGFTCCCR